jgi:hypothetical protein
VVSMVEMTPIALGGLWSHGLSTCERSMPCIWPQSSFFGFMVRM